MGPFSWLARFFTNFGVLSADCGPFCTELGVRGLPLAVEVVLIFLWLPCDGCGLSRREAASKNAGGRVDLPVVHSVLEKCATDSKLIPQRSVFLGVIIAP